MHGFQLHSEIVSARKKSFTLTHFVLLFHKSSWRRFGLWLGLFCLLTFIKSAAFAQSRYHILYANESVQNSSWRDSIYLFPNFEYGKVTFIDGFTPDYPLRLNYDMYLQNMCFIKSGGDTVPLKVEKTLKLVTIKDRQFYLDKKNGFVEIVSQGKLSLGKKEVFTPALSIEGESSLNPSFKPVIVERPMYGDVRGVAEPYDRLYRREALYYVIDEKNRTYLASRSSFLRVCRGSKKEIRKHFNTRGKARPFTHEEVMSLIKMCG